MSAANFDFEHLIAPIDADTFFRDTWEKNLLVVSRNAPDYYSRVLSMRDVGSIIYFTRPKFFGLRSSMEAEHLKGIFPQEELQYYERDNDIAALSGEYAQSKSLQIYRLEQRWQPVATLCRSLEATLRHPVNAAMFLTPKDSQGADVHYDNVDVFILQISGFKHWRIYKPTLSLPLREMADGIPEEDLVEPIQEVRLNPGDLLYMPRGYPHEAFASETSSLHITVAVQVFRWVDLISAALARLGTKDLRFRRAVPVGALGNRESTDALRDQFGELLQHFARTARVEEALDALGDRFISNLPVLPAAHFVPPEDIEQIDLDTVLERGEGVICRIVPVQDEVSIHFPGSRVTGPKQIAPALEFVATAGRFPVRALPGNFSDNSRLVLARRLVREGLLSIVREPTAH